MSCFRRRSARVEPSTPQAIEPQEEFSFIPKLFLVVGHNSKASGAVNYLGQSEYDFYLRGFPITAKYLEQLCPVIPTYIVTRPSGVSYSKQVRSVCDKISAITGGQPSFGFNGHFNSSNGAKGSEALVAKGTSENFDNLLGDIYTDLLSELDIVERRDDGIFWVSSGHNGFQMIESMSNIGCTTIIGEPCFDYKYPESITIFENVDRYFKLIAISIIRAYHERGIIIDDDVTNQEVFHPDWIDI